MRIAPLQRRVSVAPMMAYTDRHFRYLLRLVSPTTLLYTEMITAQAIAHGGRERLLAYDAAEHPVAELREPLGGVDLGHIDGTYGSRSVESTRCSQGGSGCVHCGCRVSAQPRPWRKHRDAYYRYARHPATTMVQLQCAAGLASFSQGKPSAKPCLPNISQPRLLLNTTRKRMI